jgi:hypothetical protein
MIEMCLHYGTTEYPDFKPTCAKKHKAGLKCHSWRKDCKDYVATDGGFPDCTKCIKESRCGHLWCSKVN